MQNSLQENLTHDLWYSNNNMSLHPSKTKCMVKTTKYKRKRIIQLQLNVNGIPIENVTAQKSLVLYIDNTLSRQNQYKFVCLKLNTKITLLKIINYYPTCDTKQMYYKVYIMPVFDLCSSIWGNGCKGHNQ